MPIPNETLELDASGRESLVLDVALPVLAAWTTSVQVTGFRSSMGISGLSAREVVRLRTLGLATSARATGLFEGANNFRFAYPTDPERREALTTPGVEADLGGHPLPPIVSDLSIAGFGLQVGRRPTHRLNGFTHVRGENAQGYGTRALSLLGQDLGLSLEVTTTDLGFEPQGRGLITMVESRDALAEGALNWKERGEVRGLHLTLGGVRPNLAQVDRIEAAFRETLWDSRRLEPVVHKLITSGVDQGAFVQIDVECDRGGATFVELFSRGAAPLPLARRMVKKALAYAESAASTDSVTGLAILAAAVAADAVFEIALPPTQELKDACSLLRDIGAYIEEEESLGLALLKTRPLRPDSQA